MHEFIQVRGAREHNLKNVTVKIPRDKLVVLTGLSGSGKSSLAFDTIYAEGQRRYVESLSSYARMFLGQMEKPDVDGIDGLSPAISIDQKTTSRNPRSTVGTVTEIYDYLRLLWARVGTPHCPKCGKVIKQQSIDQIIDHILELPKDTRVMVMAPVIRGKKGEYQKIFDDARRSGYVRVRVDGIVYDLGETIKPEKNKKHTVEIVVDRIAIDPDERRRLTDSVEIALGLAGGVLTVSVSDEERELQYSQNYACEDCGVSIEELSPRMFSFNNPFGACPKCTGLGEQLKVDPLRVVDPELSIREGAVLASGWSAETGSIGRTYFDAICKLYDTNINIKFKDMPEAAQNAILYGTGSERLKLRYNTARGQAVYTQPFEGIVNNLERRYKETQSDSSRRDLEDKMSAIPCPECHGDRLRRESLAVTVADLNIQQFCSMPVSKAVDFAQKLKLDKTSMKIAAPILREIRERLGFLKAVGLEYLTLARHSATLSGGESQRIRLATQIGSSLMGVLYILDEPSIGLHQRDNDKLLETLKRLRDLGNTLIVVEHDEDTMYAADHIIDVGPGAGVHGGEIIAEGTLDDILKCRESITGQYLSGRKRIPVPKKRRQGIHSLTVRGAGENNLQSVDVEFPLGTFVCVTGVSGSGKSSLVNEILYKSLAAKLNRARTRPGKHEGIDGVEWLDKVIAIDQSPIGRTPRSNPATYTGLFTDIRDLFSQTQDAKTRGYMPGRFSFNARGGRCESCSGDGVLKIEMHFLPDIYVQCDVCKGKRYNRETLEVKFKGKNIADVLDMTVDEALEFFESIPKLKRKLKTLSEVGLGYVKLGQSSTTLSGGEAQRVKLSTELSRRDTGATIYILDEPTTGLHVADVHKLIEVLNRLVDAGNTVLVIEHNLEVIKTADYVVDLGPEGGDRGGQVVACGTPEQIAKNKKSYTGTYLQKMLG